MDGLSECAVASRVPGGDTDPFFSGGVERNAKAVRAEWRLAGPRHDLPPGAPAIAPDRLDEFKAGVHSISATTRRPPCHPNRAG